MVSGVSAKRITMIATNEPIIPKPNKYPDTKIATARATVMA